MVLVRFTLHVAVESETVMVPPVTVTLLMLQEITSAGRPTLYLAEVPFFVPEDLIAMKATSLLFAHVLETFAIEMLSIAKAVPLKSLFIEIETSESHEASETLPIPRLLFTEVPLQA